MTTTSTFQGLEPGAKSSSRVLRPPGGTSNLSFGTDEDTTPRKSKMVSNIFAGPDDPHAHRRSNPPSGSAQGTLCGEPSAPLRRCQQALLFPKNPEPELTTIHNSGPALAWNQRRELENGKDAAIEDCPNDAEEESEEQKETPQPAAPSGGTDAAAAAATATPAAAAAATPPAAGVTATPPAAGVTATPPAANSSRRNPPGGKSSLILG